MEEYHPNENEYRGGEPTACGSPESPEAPPAQPRFSWQPEPQPQVRIVKETRAWPIVLAAVGVLLSVSREEDRLPAPV